MEIKRILKIITYSFILLVNNHLLAKQTEILIVRVSGENLQQVAKGIKDNISSKIEVDDVILNKKHIKISNFSRILERKKYKLIVLIGNTSVYLYKRYQEQHPYFNFPPAILLSGLKLDEMVKKIKNSVAITYETPFITAISHLRRLTTKKIKNVGILYRSWMKKSITLDEKYCRLENIHLVHAEVKNNASYKDIDFALKRLLKKRIDALLIVNDNQLLNSRIIQNMWIPKLKRFNKPVISSLEVLVTNKFAISTFAVIPDPYAMGLQAEGLINKIIKNKWQHRVVGRVYKPLSVKKIFNLKLSNNKEISINRKNLNSVDILVQ